jgi:flagellar motor switch protein FliM
MIILDRRAEEDLDMLVEGTPKFSGRFGIYKGSYALKITRVIAHSS